MSESLDKKQLKIIYTIAHDSFNKTPQEFIYTIQWIFVLYKKKAK